MKGHLPGLSMDTSVSVCVQRRCGTREKQWTHHRDILASIAPEAVDLEGRQVQELGRHELEEFGFPCVLSVLKFEGTQVGQV